MNFHFDGARWLRLYGVAVLDRKKDAANDRLFPFWSNSDIERIVKNLKEKGVLLTANYARDSYDRTLFYALDETNYPFHCFGG